MKSYKVKAKLKFNDTVDNIVREIGDEFLCTEERYKYLLEHNAIEFIEEIIVEEEKVEKFVEPKKKNKRFEK